MLLVDDHAAILDRAAKVLGADCTIVGAVGDGQSALDAVAMLHPDVIVLDITMPGMSGLEVATRLRDEQPPLAIVFLSVHKDEEWVQAAKATGAIGYVFKSRLALDLAEAVAEAFAGRAFASPTL